MSGPKVYSPPPEYSVSMFRGTLHAVFVAQGRLRALQRELSSLRCSDARYEVAFDCSACLERTRADVGAALEAVELAYRGTFGEKVRAEIEVMLDARLRKLSRLCGELDQERTRFRDKRDDLTAYAAYQDHCDQIARSVERFRADVIDYVRAQAGASAPGASARAEGRLAAYVYAPDAPRTPFEFGFRERAGAARGAAEEHAEGARSELLAIRDSADDARAAAVRAEFRRERERARDAPIEAVRGDIRAILAGIDDLDLREGWSARLEKLDQAKVLRGVYYYRELHRELHRAEKGREAGAGARALIDRLERAEPHVATAEERTTLLERARALVGASRARPEDVANLTASVEAWERSDAARRERDEVAARERDFLRRQVVGSLRSLGYEVVEDMEVVDLDRRGEVVLSVPGQENLVDLHFREDGSFVYNFLVPETLAELSPERRREKVAEMETACRGFHQVVDELAAMGLSLSVVKEKPTAESSLLEVPARLGRTVAARATRRRNAAAGAEKRIAVKPKGGRGP